MKKLICLVLAVMLALSAVSAFAIESDSKTIQITINDFEEEFLPSFFSGGKLNLSESDTGFEFSAQSDDYVITGTADSDKVISEFVISTNGNYGVYEKAFDSYTKEMFRLLTDDVLSGNTSSYNSGELKFGFNVACLNGVVLKIAFPNINMMNSDEAISAFYKTFDIILDCRNKERLLNGWRISYSIIDDEYVFTGKYSKDGIGLITNDKAVVTNNSSWSYSVAVDEFGDAVDAGFIVGTFTGNFSNTATISSDLQVYVYFDGENTDFRLLEYNSTKATYTSDEASSITMKTKINGDVQEYLLFGNAPNDDIELKAFYNDNYTQFIQSIYDGEEISCVVYIGSSKYNFKITGEGFAQEYNDKYL